MVEPLQGFLEGSDVLLDALTQASQQKVVFGLGAVGVGAPGDKGQSRSWHSHQSSRAQNLGSPGREHQLTSRSTFVGGTRCTSMVELLGSVGEVVGQGQGGLVLGEGKVDKEEDVEEEVAAQVDVEVDKEEGAGVDAEEEVVAQVDVVVDAEEEVEAEGVEGVLEFDGEVAP